MTERISNDGCLLIAVAIMTTILLMMLFVVAAVKTGCCP